MTSATSLASLPRPFWLYWAGVSLTALGDTIVYVALPFLALSVGAGLTGAGAVGLVVLAGSLPRFLGPLLGGLADRLPPRRLLAFSAGIRGLAVLGMGLWGLFGSLPLAALLALAFVNGLLSTLAYTAGSALVPRLVAPDALARALIHAFGAAGALLVGVPLILALCAVALALPRLGAAQSGGRPQPLADLRAGLAAIRSSPLLLALLGMSFTLNLASNVMNTRAPLQMTVHGRGAADYAAFEMLISGGVLLGIVLVTPLSARTTLDAVIGLGRWVLVAGTLGFVLSPIPVWWAGAAVFGIGLGLLEVAATTRSQQLTGLEVRGRVIGALLGINAMGLSVGAGLAALPLPTPGLMLGLAALLLCLALLWPAALRLQRLRASSRASANPSSSSSQG
ncbi:hypothetical protein ACI3L1_05240 [Deinococcus sp. SM5_A1]|uniref:hypothetical protein n=1 Tax=Deinococcus sp. SM5_A1 TaxID=3379094 RepID=UPI00385A96AB